jgi:hypothetical protein
MDASVVTIAHAIPGRVRLKIAQLRHDAAFADELRQRLTSIEEVQQVEINARTGSVVLLYDAAMLSASDSLHTLAESLTALFPGLTAEDLNAFASLSTNGAAAAAIPAVGRGVRTFFAEINENIERVTGGSVDLKVLLPLALFTLGVRSLLKSDKLISPMWYDFLWFAFGAYFMLNPKPGDSSK